MADIEVVIKIPEEVKNRLCFGVTYSKDIQVVCEALNNSTPLPSWTPVTERPPKEATEVLVDDGDCMSVGFVYYRWDGEPIWHVDCNDEENDYYFNPIAWQPLPKHYKAESEDKK